jgi:hypothetical protein
LSLLAVASRYLEVWAGLSTQVKCIERVFSEGLYSPEECVEQKFCEVRL